LIQLLLLSLWKIANLGCYIKYFTGCLKHDSNTRLAAGFNLNDRVRRFASPADAHAASPPASEREHESRAQNCWYLWASACGFDANPHVNANV